MVFWIGLGLAVWLDLAVLVALLVGKMIRQRDGQWHHLDEPSTARAHSQMAAHDGMTDTRPVELVRGAHAPPTTASELTLATMRNRGGPQPRLVPAGRELARFRHVAGSPLHSR